MNIAKIVKFVIFGMGLLLLVVTVLIYNKTSQFIEASVIAEGVVIDLELYENAYHPIVQFKTSDKQKFEFRSSTGSNPPSHSAGEKVEVIYSSGNPDKAKINSFFSLWFGSLITGVMGILFLLVAIVITFVQKQKKITFTEYED